MADTTSNLGLHYPLQKDNPLEARRFLDEIDSIIGTISPVAGIAEINVVTEGDSITEGAVGPVDPWPDQLVAMDFLADRSTLYNVAVSGSGMTLPDPPNTGLNIPSRYTANVYPKRPSANGGTPCLLFLWAGINDINDGATAADIFTELETYWATAVSDGFTVIAVTPTPNGNNSRALQEVRQDLVRMIKGSAIPHFVVSPDDILSDPEDLDTYQDELHPTTEGNRRIAVYFNDVLAQGGGLRTNDVAQRLIGATVGRVNAIGIGTDPASTVSLHILQSGEAVRIYSAVAGDQTLISMFSGTGLLNMGVENDIVNVSYSGSYSGASFFINGSSTPMQWGTAGTAQMTLLTSGFLGVGLFTSTKAPTARLHVLGSGLSYIMEASAATAGVYGQIQTGNGSGLTLIGSESSVAGTIFATSLAYASFFGSGATGADVQIITGGVSRIIVTSSSVSFTGNVLPQTDDGAQIGSTSKRWSDLFLAEGGVIDWDNGDVTLTQTGNQLALAGGAFKITSSNGAFLVVGADDTSAVFCQFNTSAGSAIGYWGVESSTGGSIITGTAAYAAIFGGAGTVQFIAGGAVKATLNASNNFGLGVTAFGTSGVKVLGIGNGTEPSTSPADMIQIYSVDISAGNASLGLRTETAVNASAAGASDAYLDIRINGTTYKLLLHT